MKKIYQILGLVLVIILVSVVAIDKEEEVNNLNENNMEENNGLVIDVLQEGTGDVAENGKMVSVHYTGTFENGEVFDSSVSRGVPFEFMLGAGMVIQGWDQGVLGMKVGEKRKLTIAPELAYGPNDHGPIPGGSTLIFEVELLGVK